MGLLLKCEIRDTKDKNEVNQTARSLSLATCRFVRCKVEERGEGTDMKGVTD